MHAMTSDARTSRSRDYQWWRGMDPTAPLTTDDLDIPATPLLDSDWCAIRHVALGKTPHRVHFRRDSHTLMIFDRGSFVEGEKWVGGDRVATSGPLDVGVDIVPAHAEFQAWAGPGSNVGCTLISIVPDGFDEAVGTSWSSPAALRPSIGLRSDLLLPLAARLRHLSRPENATTGDRSYLESLCMVLCREVLLAQDEGHATRLMRPTGGLSSRAQRLVKDFMHDNLDRKIDLPELAALAGVSQFHFARAFKVSFGTPPHKYLLNLRLRKAAELLRDTRNSITDIALSVGFSCSSEFARAFRQAMDCTPREFRQAGHPLNRVAEVA